MESNGTRILICDDHALFRSGLISLLKDEPSIYIIGEAADGNELITKYYETYPDLILVDISMPGMSGLEALKKLREDGENVKILFLSMMEGDQYVYHILKEKGSGLLNKNVVKGELIYAINTVMNGKYYFGPKYPEEKLNELIKNYKGKNNPEIDKTLLTKREEEVLKFISRGYTSDQIAEELNIGKRTIDTHRHNIMQKFDIKNLPALIKFAIEYYDGKED